MLILLCKITTQSSKPSIATVAVKMKIKFQVYNRQQSQIYLISINLFPDFQMSKKKKNPNKNNKNNKKQQL